MKNNKKKKLRRKSSSLVRTFVSYAVGIERGSRFEQLRTKLANRKWRRFQEATKRLQTSKANTQFSSDQHKRWRTLDTIKDKRDENVKLTITGNTIDNQLKNHISLFVFASLDQSHNSRTCLRVLLFFDRNHVSIRFDRLTEFTLVSSSRLNCPHYFLLGISFCALAI